MIIKLINFRQGGVRPGLARHEALCRCVAQHHIDSLDEFKSFFTAKDPKKPEIHAGFADCYFCEDPAVDEILKELKVTIRCIPLDYEKAAGKCIFTGGTSQAKAVFAKAY